LVFKHRIPKQIFDPVDGFAV
jgi:hypothetical protein